MKRKETIKDKKLFNNIIRKSKFKKNEYFVIYNEETDSEKNNFGIAISKKVGNAVTRNKLKRQVRAIIDSNRNLFQNQHNYIIMIRKSCVDTKYQVLDSALKKLLEK